jgi:hypothetical protein
MSRLSLDRDPAEIRKSIDPGSATKTAITRRLDAAEWHLRLVVHGRSIDVAHPRLDLFGNPKAARGISSENRRGKSILGIVRQP